MQYFEESEFSCPCCGKGTISSEMKLFLSAARRIAGIPFVINSAFRCRRHNVEVGGLPTSSHLKGLAVDLKCKNSKERFKILSALLLIGFKRIGIGENFIHADLDDSKPDKIIFLY